MEMEITNLTAQRECLLHLYPALSELMQLMRWIIQWESATTELGSECAWMLQGEGNTIVTYRDEGERVFRHMLRGNDVPASIVAWQRLLLRHFQRPLNRDDWPLCVLPQLEHCVPASEVRVLLPTFHERLEARLQLRQWLEQNAPDQIETLLPS